MSKGLKTFLTVLIIVLLIYLVIALLPRGSNFAKDNPLKVGDGELPLLIAHRGGAGEFPGNTLEAFYNAYSVDPRAVMETDGCITSDGVLILTHDTYLDDYTNVTGDVIDWSYEDLISQRVNFGYDNDTDDSGNIIQKRFENEDGVQVLPTDVDYPDGIEARDSEIYLATTFEELLAAFPETIISIEIKQEGDVGLRAFDEAIRLIREYDAFDRVIVASFHNEIYRASKKLARSGDVPEDFMFSPSLSGVIKYYALCTLGLDALFTDSVAVLQIPDEQLGFRFDVERIVKCADRHNVATHYWTIDDEDEMRRLISIGADGIMTDYPHRLKSVYDSYGE